MAVEQHGLKDQRKQPDTNGSIRKVMAVREQLEI